jgi:hypothetical protein
MSTSPPSGARLLNRRHRQGLPNQVRQDDLYDAPAARRLFNGIGDLLRQPRLNAVGSAMEVGYGEGFSTRKLRELLPLAASLRASDVEQRLVDAARRNNPGVPIERESIYELPHADGAFDAARNRDCEGRRSATEQRDRRKA